MKPAVVIVDMLKDTLEGAHPNIYRKNPLQPLLRVMMLEALLAESCGGREG